MSTSGSYDNTTTLAEIIKDAFSLIGAIDDNEPIPADMFVYGKRTLNRIMSFLSTHRGLWLIDDVTITLTPGTKSYQMGVGLTVNTPKPMEIKAASSLVSTTYERPMAIVDREEYSSIPNKILQAPPQLVYYDIRRDNGILYVWPTGTSTEKTISVTVQRPIQDFDSEGNNPDLPKEWVLVIIYMLAVAVSPKYLGGIVPPDIKAQSAELMISVMGFDAEKVSIFFKK